VSQSQKFEDFKLNTYQNQRFNTLDSTTDRTNNFRIEFSPPLISKLDNNLTKTWKDFSDVADFKQTRRVNSSLDNYEQKLQLKAVQFQLENNKKVESRHIHSKLSDIKINYLTKGCIPSKQSTERSVVSRYLKGIYYLY
jgi:hypothetical protein